MSVYVPRDGKDVLKGTPILGSTAEIDEISDYLKNIEADAQQYRREVQSALLALTNTSSRAVTKLSEKLDGRLCVGANSLQQSTEQGRNACNSYAAEIDRIHTDARNVVRDVETALTTIQVQAWEVEEIAEAILAPVPARWDEEVPKNMPEPQLWADVYGTGVGPAERPTNVAQLRSLYETRWLGAAHHWHVALEDIRGLQTKWANLIEDRRDVENWLRGALSNTIIGQLLTVSSAGATAQRFTIATALSGELWGKSYANAKIAMTHPLLLKLIGSKSGANAWDDPPAPELVANAWAGLSAEEQATLIAEVPWVIGNLPGLPYAVRDTANRNMLEFYREHPHMLSLDQLKLLSDLQEIFNREVSETLKYGEARPPIQLVALDLTGPVSKTAVGYGDLDTATDTTLEGPGMASDAHLALEGWDEASRNLYAAQSDISGYTGSTAVIAWLGYDTPDSPFEGDLGVLSSEDAAIGAKRFAAELDGLHVARSTSGNGMPTVNVLAHSYGTTLASIALTEVKYTVSTFTMLGSAGLDTEIVPSYEVLNVADAEPGKKAIYTTHASGDHLAPLGAGFAGRGQPNPDASAIGLENLSPVYGGAFSFSSEGDPSRGLLKADGHSTIGEGSRPGPIGMTASEGHGYMDRRTQTLDTVAHITTGMIDAELEESFVITEAEPKTLYPGLGFRVLVEMQKAEYSWLH
ncbi:alpha/beta hydrolase [Leucobacter denitrificans]|uniref:DUF1023 domain-containing protein n=1 Tax=Leucobacter denitrificans TaxID=683042 RepID=A0A7G9S2J4_9MICO|nr:alpha/beta hydrolase [Leucobacter denitrificans]QNN62069.1 hypothetical protein H9L06_07065 [Leucobacter denitrificans]